MQRFYPENGDGLVTTPYPQIGFQAQKKREHKTQALYLDLARPMETKHRFQFEVLDGCDRMLGRRTVSQAASPWLPSFTPAATPVQWA
ncbi:MAG: hypothetical protein JJT90_05375 [Ectothiorhodospiraceae bacterium]|nr:hypothetical protein [Ectothiorhodospiraceae bacterium]